jgi:hypothetical protein
MGSFRVDFRVPFSLGPQMLRTGVKSLIAVVAVLGALALVPPLPATAQPFPVPQGPPGRASTTYDAQGRKYESFTTPTGSVTYAPNGERFESFTSPAGVVTTYGDHDQRYESFPDPSAVVPSERH